MAAATPAASASSGGELSITVKPTDDGAGGDDELQQQSESRSADDDMVRTKLKTLNKMVFCVVLLEWAGNAAGTLAFIWATVVLLGGFCSLLMSGDFWFATAMVFMEGSTWVFIRKDVSISHWIIYGSKCAFRWKDFSLPRMLVGQTFGKLSVVSIGVGVALVPEFPPEIASSILKVAFLVIISQLLTRVERGSFVHMVLLLLGIACVSGAMYGYVKTAPQRSSSKTGSSKHDTLASLKATGLAFAWLFGTTLLTGLACGILSFLRFLRNPMPLLGFKIFIASALACLPFLQAPLASHYRYLSIPAAVTLLMVSNEVFWWRADDDDDSSSGTTLEEKDCSIETAERETSEQEENTGSSSDGLLLQIVETTLPILFFWSVMFPLPAGMSVSLMLSFYTLFSVIAGVLLDNLQIPVAFLQVLVSILRLHTLQGYHGHDYNPQHDGGSPNLVPSVAVFYILELCHGSSNLLAAILGFTAFLRRISLARDLGFQQEWGAKAISLYFRQAYQARMQTGLFCQEQHTPSLESFAIQSLGCTSSSRQMQIVGLRILDNSLRRGDSESNKKLIITEIVKDAANIITNIIGLISCYLTVEESSGSLQHHRKSIEKMEQHQKKWTEQMEVARLCLEFVRTIASNGGKISARFRKELSENPFFLDSLDRTLNLWGWRVDGLREQAMGIVATLAVDEAARKEIGSNQSIITNLMREFEEPSMYDDDDDRSSLRMAAGEALANLTINSADNCWAILLADPEHNGFITTLIDMLDDEYYICVAANLLRNLCANSRDMLIDLAANVNLESALSKAMKIIRTKEGKQLEAALCVASQIGYVIPEYVAQELDSDTDAAAAEQLVTKLVDTLQSIREPCLEYPRIRRVLVEVLVSIVELCPGYIKIFRAKGAKDALDMVKGTPSRLEKYRVFLGGEGVVLENLTMRDLVDNAKRLIYEATPTPCNRIPGTSRPCMNLKGF